MRGAEGSGAEALHCLDKALAARPKKDDHALSATLRALSALRDTLSANPSRSAASVQDLSRLNAVISVVMAGQYPLGEVPWDELGKARTWLSALVGSVGAHPPRP